MKLSNFRIIALAILTSAVGSAAYLTGVTSGNTTFQVNDTNRIAGGNNNITNNATNPAQMGRIQAFGFEVLDVQDHTADFGYQIGDASSFVTNYIGGAGANTPPVGFTTTSVLPNSPVAGTVSTTGSFTAGGINVLWTRTYRFIAANIIEEVYTVQNAGTAAITNFRGFGVYDPDALNLGNNFGNFNSFNSVGTFGTAGEYALASFSSLTINPAGLNAVLATTDARVNIGFSGTTNINGSCVDAIVNGSTNCGVAINNQGGAGQDRAYAYAFNIANFLTGAQNAQSFTVYHLFGNSTFNLANSLASLPLSGSSSSGGGAVPEPGSLVMLGSACVALGLFARRRAKQ
ncbi:MAG: PEP-CTERM sorting domain-containing protein [Bryobacteraceae bacterium]|nr:PEP-CTERM sorting domain-containing protein [Bryobacteraceae bacterium]